MVETPDIDAQHRRPDIDTDPMVRSELSAPDRVRARRIIRRNVLWVSFVIIAFGIAGVLIAPAMHIMLAVPIVIIVAGVLGALLALALRRASSSDRSSRG